MRIARGISIANTSKPISTAIVYDADAAAFFTAASITDTTQKSAVNQLVLDLKSANIWTKMKALYPVVGGVASSHAVNLKTPGTYNLTFATGWTHASTGMTPNGATYADSNLNPSLNFSVNDNMHMSFYSRTNVSQISVDIGNKTVAPSNIYNMLSIRRSDQSNNTYYGINTVSGFATFIDSNSAAFYLSTRIGTLTNGFRNNTKTATNTSAASTRANLKIVLSALNEGGSILPGFYSTKQCAFASIGDGLTDVEASSFYTAIQNYQTTLGRQV